MKGIAYHIASDVPRPDGRMVLVHKIGLTSDIISELVATYKDSRGQTGRLAPRLQGQTVRDTARNIWQFIRSTVRYHLDPDSKQFLKEPARTLHDGYADCKGYSILAASLLSDLGIPARFEFVAYGPGPATHVYVVAIDPQGREIIIDPCWGIFSSTKQNIVKKQVMAEIYRLSGPGDAAADADFITVFLKQVQDGAAMEKQARASEGYDTAQYDALIHALKDARAYIADPEAVRIIARQYDAGLYNVKQVAAAIKFQGSLEDLKQRLGELRRRQIQKGYSPSVAEISGIGSIFGDIFRFFTKTLTAPMRAVAKLVLTELLPKASPFFIYLFLPPGVAFPEKVMRKKAKAEKWKNWIVKHIGIKEDKFIALIKAGVIKTMGNTADRIIQGWIPPQPPPTYTPPQDWVLTKPLILDAIGEPVTLSVIIAALVKILPAIISVFAGSGRDKPETPTESDIPGPSDWEGWNQSLPTSPTPPSGSPGSSTSTTTPAQPTGGSNNTGLLIAAAAGIYLLTRK